MVKTFVDAGVLIDAARSNLSLASKALAILSDPRRIFVSSPFVKLEVLPKAIYHKRVAESAFYERFFQSVSEEVVDYTAIVDKAQSISEEYGLSALDALHVAAALLAGCDELITTEKPDKPMFRLNLEVRVVAIA
jgi:predicted nucleic acid-binding protein